MSDKYLFDTNALLTNPEYMNVIKKPVISKTVLRELDKIKMEESTRGYQARRAFRIIKAMFDKIEFVDWSDERIDFHTTLISPILDNDAKIVQSAINHKCNLVTGDIGMQVTFRHMTINTDLELVDVFDTLVDAEYYKGWKEVYAEHAEYSHFLQNLNHNHFELNVNEYLAFYTHDFEGDQVCSLWKWNGQTHIEIKRKQIDSKQFDKIISRDVYQQFALDSLLNNQMTMIKGKAGSGKSLLSLATAFHLIEKGKFSRLICFVNPTASRFSAKLGFYPGSRDEKLFDSSVGSMLSAKLGGDKYQLKALIDKGELMLMPMSDIRGFDTTGLNAIVYIMEAQNLDVDLAKLAIQRVGEDSKLIIDGDYQAQVDSTHYEGSKNGMRRVSQIFRGEDYYGEIELPNIFRSKIASKADEM